MTPIIGILGPAGSGKDTFANLLIEGRNGICVAQADPMKRLVKFIFDFTDDQLWGPSSSRNAVDARYTSKEIWDSASNRLFDFKVVEMLRQLGLFTSEYRDLQDWFKDQQNSNSPMTPRRILQTLGTEFGRNINVNVWSNYALSVSDSLLYGGYNYNKFDGSFPLQGHVGYNFVCITDVRFRNEALNILKKGGLMLKIINPIDESAAVEAAGIKGHISESELKGIPNSWYNEVICNDKAFGLTSLKSVVDGFSSRFRVY